MQNLQKTFDTGVWPDEDEIVIEKKDDDLI